MQSHELFSMGSGRGYFQWAARAACIRPGVIRATDPARDWRENIQRQYRLSGQVCGKSYNERESLTK